MRERDAGERGALHDLLSGQLSVLVLIELGIEAGGGGGWRPVGLTLLEELEAVVASYLWEQERDRE